MKEEIPEIPHINGSVDWNYSTSILADTAQLLLQKFNTSDVFG